MRSFCYRLIILAVAIVSFCACQEESTEVGTLVVPFKLGSGNSCESRGIDQVRATLDGDYYVETVSCGDMQVRFDDIASGTYLMELFGFDTQQVAVMEALDLDPVKVEKNNTVVVEPEVRLVSAPAKVLLRWALGFGSCESFDIDSFQVVTYSDDGDSVLLETSIDCNAAGEDANNYRLIADPDRDLTGGQLDVVEITPLDVNGTPIGTSEAVQFVLEESPGSGYSVMFSIDCDADGCQGNGQPD
jgi:hypothetical protein